jgi:hypothetical protein
MLKNSQREFKSGSEGVFALLSGLSLIYMEMAVTRETASVNNSRTSDTRSLFYLQRDETFLFICNFKQKFVSLALKNKIFTALLYFEGRCIVDVLVS